MTKDVIIGTLCGVAAMVVFRGMTPKAPVAPAPSATVLAQYYRAPDVLDLPYLPTTQPDAARHKLSRTIGNVRLKQIPFEDVLAYLTREADLNISVNWHELQVVGIRPASPVTVDYQNATARDILQAAIKDAGKGNVKLSYVIIDGMIKISTEDDLSQYHVTRIYDVRDIIAQTTASDRLRLAPPAITFDRKAPPAEIDALIALIEESVDPASWRDAGGTIGGIRGFDGSLVVTQTLPNHEKLADILEDLRKR